MKRSGFMLMEVVLALAVFAIVITGVVASVNAAATVVSAVTREQWIQKQQQNLLVETLTTPQTLAEFTSEKTVSLGDFGAEGFVQVEPLELENQDREVLGSLYEVKIEIRWLEGSERRNSVITTHHFYPLYQQ